MSFKNFTDEMKAAYLIGMCAGKNVAESCIHCPDFQEMLTYIYEYKASNLELTEELLMECLNEFGEVCNRYYMGRDKVIVNLSDIECYEKEDEIDYIIYKNDEWIIETCKVKDLYNTNDYEVARVVKIDDKKYLVSKMNNDVYDYDTYKKQEERVIVGKWNGNNIEFIEDKIEEEKEEIKDGLICVSSLEDAKHIRRMFCLFHPELQHLREQTIKEIEEEEN